jgi:IMP dehydrogenase
MATFHPELPRGARVKTKTVGTLRDILVGPAPVNDGTMNLFGALATSIADTGFQNVRDFQRVEVAYSPSFLSEGKTYQRAQGVGMG